MVEIFLRKLLLLTALVLRGDYPLSHGINANVIRKWLPPGPVPMARAPVLLPVMIEPDTPPAQPAATQPIELSMHGATLCLPPGFAAQDLRSILQVLRSLP